MGNTKITAVGKTPEKPCHGMNSRESVHRSESVRKELQRLLFERFPGNLSGGELKRVCNSWYLPQPRY